MATATAPQPDVTRNMRAADRGCMSLAANGGFSVSRDDVIDTVTDILHAADRHGLQTVGILDVAGENFDVERAAAELEGVNGR